MMDQMMGKMKPAAESAGGFKICIKVDGQGAISVGLGGDESQEMGESMGDPMGDAGMQQVGSIQEALSAALSIYKSNGQQGESDEGMADMMRGYGKPKNIGGMGPNRVFGEE